MKLLVSRRMERKRQVAARGDIRLLAEEQPNEDISIVLPPFTIEVRTDWRGYSVFIGMLLLLLALSVGAATIFVYVPTFIGIGIGSLMSAGFIALLLYMVMLPSDLHADQEITATAYGLIKKNGARRMERIAWHDVRLFAIDGVFGLGKYPYPVLFEVASKDQIVTFYWTHKQSRGLFLPITRPAGSYEEYDRQMRMLLTIIARQTGLPLYDIRKDVQV